MEAEASAAKKTKRLTQNQKHRPRRKEYLAQRREPAEAQAEREREEREEKLRKRQMWWREKERESLFERTKAVWLARRKGRDERFWYEYWDGESWCWVGEEPANAGGWELAMAGAGSSGDGRVPQTIVDLVLEVGEYNNAGKKR